MKKMELCLLKMLKTQERSGGEEVLYVEEGVPRV